MIDALKGIVIIDDAPQPEQTEAVLAILLEVGVLRYDDDGTLLRLAEGGYEPYVP